MIVGGSLAESTFKQQLSNIEAIYRHVDDNRRSGFLDDALGNQNLSLLEELLEAYFVTLRNVPEVSSTAQTLTDRFTR